MPFCWQKMSLAGCVKAFRFSGMVAWPASRRQFQFNGFLPAKVFRLLFPFGFGAWPAISVVGLHSRPAISVRLARFASQGA
jgi:hypothetical protein